MTRDPLYRQIMEGLGKRLDSDLFERAMADLLRSAYPSLAPVPGGADEGMDGTIASTSTSPIALVTTTGGKTIGNLRRNLQTYKNKGHTSRLAVFATSQALTPKRRATSSRRLPLRASTSSTSMTGPELRTSCTVIQSGARSCSALPAIRGPCQSCPSLLAP